jgi:hypothetical protein
MSEVITRAHIDEGEKLIHFQRIQYVEPILDWNKWAQTEKQKHAGSFRHIGRIPNVILEKWMNDDGVNVLAMHGDDFGNTSRRNFAIPTTHGFAQRVDESKWLSRRIAN